MATIRDREYFRAASAREKIRRKAFRDELRERIRLQKQLDYDKKRGLETVSGTLLADEHSKRTSDA